MKTGARRRTTTSSDPPPPPHPVKTETDDQLTDKNGGNEYNEEENEDDDAQSDDPYVNGGQNDQRPKLAEGFYEIEALRKTRIRKGVKQYLIKWRGWPESANSWEPAESFMSCPDVLEAFESMNSGKRKRKRKHTVDSTSQSKKKRKQPQDSSNAAYHIPSARIKITEEPVLRPHAHNSNVGGANYNETTNQSNELEGKLDETKTASSMDQENMTEFAIHIKEDPVESANGVDGTEVTRATPRIGAAHRISKVVGTEVRRSSPRIGAAKGVSKVAETEVYPANPQIGSRRRKSCAVKRYKKASNSAPKKDATEEPTTADEVIFEDDVKNIDDMVNGLEDDNILETPQSVPVITKIVKPVNYSISVINDTEDVSVSFLVKRSDEEEIVVDNKYLKENNPVLLIDFYEQHLRYNSASE
ncbi:hypothetical protein QVD17_15125 [Tagetes erecta]|uniref:Chromo domain-containing protein n=1 Tax=Tagetes erecta TaxID=13708 RepID=A0AAD8NYD7_TARER|nr:hypothetical protein QVD17_15125 [Tagetes erecta]